MPVRLAPVTALLATATLALSACGGPRQLALPEDGVERAATCGVVAAAQARLGQTPQEVSKPLPLDAQGRILHDALLAGDDGTGFSQDRVAAVVARMPALGDSVTKGKWQALIPACTQAYPQTAADTAIELPSDPLDAQLSCYTLAGFLDRALTAQGDAYMADLARYSAMRRNLDTRIGSKLAAEGKATAESQADSRAARLGAAAKLGPPTKVMDACVAKYG